MRQIKKNKQLNKTVIKISSGARGGILPNV